MDKDPVIPEIIKEEVVTVALLDHIDRLTMSVNRLATAAEVIASSLDLLLTPKETEQEDSYPLVSKEELISRGIPPLHHKITPEEFRMMMENRARIGQSLPQEEPSEQQEFPLSMPLDKE